ncbi:N-myc proto-oncogene protein-like [Heterodontus francisci]|uniref:N-myc proto-oncogene protein-like n=1 Tax=Heterodontus francisci TaxID=7792 RepID=UPI00355BF28A
MVYTSGPAVAGLPACKDLNIVTIHEVTKAPITAEEIKCTCIESVQDSQQMYPGRFDATGDFKGDAVLHLKEDTFPVSSPLMSEIESQFFQDLSGSGLESSSPFSEKPNQENKNPKYLSTGSVSSLSSGSEEEVDVVTSEKQRLAVGSIAKGKSPEIGTRSQTRASIKWCSLEIQQQHNYAVPSPLLSRKLPAPKRARTERYLRETKYSSPNKSLTLSPRTSDAEDKERQRTHNVPKKQRRNELKHCRLALRDEVLELSKNDKASKVVILRKTREYISRLKAEQKKLKAEREKLQDKQQQ